MRDKSPKFVLLRVFFAFSLRVIGRVKFVAYRKTNNGPQATTKPRQPAYAQIQYPGRYAKNHRPQTGAEGSD